MRPGSFTLGGLLVVAAVGSGPRAVAEPGEGKDALVVQIRGLRNDAGQLLVALFETSRGFPDHPEKALRTAIVERHGAEHAVRFAGVAPGDYAVAFVHDENRNRKLDVNFIGIPKEGFGVSNNVRPTIGAPAYRDAEFHYGGGERALEIRAIYY